MLFNQMKTIKQQVRSLLIDYPHLRDDDFKLIASFYRFNIGTEELKKMSGFDFLTMFALGKLPHSESIRRVRQKLQEKEHNLRGKGYKNRKKDGRETTKLIEEL